MISQQTCHLAGVLRNIEPACLSKAWTTYAGYAPAYTLHHFIPANKTPTRIPKSIQEHPINLPSKSTVSFHLPQDWIRLRILSLNNHSRKHTKTQISSVWSFHVVSNCQFNNVPARMPLPSNSAQPATTSKSKQAASPKSISPTKKLLLLVVCILDPRHK